MQYDMETPTSLLWAYRLQKQMKGLEKRFDNIERSQSHQQPYEDHPATNLDTSRLEDSDPYESSTFQSHQNKPLKPSTSSVDIIQETQVDLSLLPINETQSHLKTELATLTQTPAMPISTYIAIAQDLLDRWPRRCESMIVGAFVDGLWDKKKREAAREHLDHSDEGWTWREARKFIVTDANMEVDKRDKEGRKEGRKEMAGKGKKPRRLVIPIDQARHWMKTT
ncbi:MAG: hypothetical protein M1834_007227 [Cirrosporium novae-zelandiae]|nr:MAG: hypothetical protein M1834_007227 [Cirrosporium novae-zelandiae]